jgi:hypothetical protein
VPTAVALASFDVATTSGIVPAWLQGMGLLLIVGFVLAWRLVSTRHRQSTGTTS